MFVYNLRLALKIGVQWGGRASQKMLSGKAQASQLTGGETWQPLVGGDRTVPGSAASLARRAVATTDAMEICVLSTKSSTGQKLLLLQLLVGA